MQRFLGTILGTALLIGAGGSARADDKEARAVLDKAIKALGGEDKLSKVKAASWTTKGKVNFGGNDSEFSLHVTVQGLDHFRSDFQGDNNGTKVDGVTIVAGDKGWRKFGDTGMAMDENGLANLRRSIYLTVVPITLVQLKGKGFKIESADEQKVGDKPAVGLKVTAPDGKDFTLYFDKESGLPVKIVNKAMGFMGGEVTSETTFAGYKDFDGIKKATKMETKRNGQKFQDGEVTEFKVLDKVDPKTFEEPK